MAAETEPAVTSPCITSAGGEVEAVTLQELRLTTAAARVGLVLSFGFFVLFCVRLRSLKALASVVSISSCRQPAGSSSPLSMMYAY